VATYLPIRFLATANISQYVIREIIILAIMMPNKHTSQTIRITITPALGEHQEEKYM
jgi:hypothetical protein